MRMAKHRGKSHTVQQPQVQTRNIPRSKTRQNPNDVLNEVSNFYVTYLRKRNVREKRRSVDSLTVLLQGPPTLSEGRHQSHIAEDRRGMCDEEILVRSVPERFPRTFP